MYISIDFSQKLQCFLHTHMKMYDNEIQAMHSDLKNYKIEEILMINITWLLQSAHAKKWNIAIA